MTVGRFTRFISEWPPVLGKRFRLDGSGALHKDTSGDLSRGRYFVDTFTDASTLIERLQSFGANEALSASLPIDGSTNGAIHTEAKLADNPGAKARTSRFFCPDDSPGLGIVDIDDSPFTLDQLREEVLAAAPGLADVPLIGWYSASSLVFNGDTCLSPAKGLRVYIPVLCASDWPRALRALNARLALRGHFRCIVSSSGAILNRPLADAAMGDQGARLDFAPSGSICAPPLEQRRPPPQILNRGAATFIDTRKAIPDLPQRDASRFRAVVQAAREAVRAEAEAIKASCRERDVTKAEGKARAEGKAFDAKAAMEQVQRVQAASFQGQLLPGFGLIHVDDEGREHIVTVAEILASAEQWHRQKFLCPLNPEHRHRSADAIAYTAQAVPVIFDLDTHTSFKLIRQQLSVQVVPGGRAHMASAIAAHLCSEPDVYLLNGQLVLIAPREARLTSSTT